MFQVPIKKGYTIYTKNHCSYCLKAKILLEKEIPLLIECDDYLSDPVRRDFFLAFIEDLAGKSHTTFPIVFLDGNYIGGYAETVQYVNKQNAFSEFHE